jgi:hypothetical protein
MKKAHLIAVKPMRYGTRRLRAGDTFDAMPSEATIFRALRWAGDAPVAAVAPVKAKPALPDPVPRPVRAVDVVVPPPAVIDDAPRAAVLDPADDLDVLRTEYEMRAGKPADKRWGATRLKTEIEALA